MCVLVWCVVCTRLVWYVACTGQVCWTGVLNVLGCAQVCCIYWIGVFIKNCRCVVCRWDWCVVCTGLRCVVPDWCVACCGLGPVCSMYWCDVFC